MSRSPIVDVAVACGLTDRLDLDSVGGAQLHELRKKTPHKSVDAVMLSVLAAEVERLEAEHIEAMAAITAASRASGQERTRAEAAEARISWLEQQREEECKQKEAALKESGMCLKETRDFKERAFKAEARVAELEAEALNGRHAVFTDLKAQLAAANEQNARLRGTLMRVTGSLGLVLKGAGIAAPAHKENYDAAKKLIEETFSGDREEAST